MIASLRLPILGFFLSLGWLIVLFYLPFILSLLLLLIWLFISIGQVVVDGYMKAIVGGILAGTIGWNTVALLPTFLGHSDYVQYAGFMIEAQFFVGLAATLAAFALFGVGLRALLKARRSATSETP